MMLPIWFIQALLCLVLWGTADLFYKKGTDERDPYSHIRIAIMVGFVMGAQALYMILFKMDTYHPMDMIIYLPVSAMYIISMVIGYAGLRYLEVSIVSPLQNTSGAVAGLMSFIFLGQRMRPMQVVAIILITIGVTALSYLEKKYQTDELIRGIDPALRKYRLGALALIFPLLYAIIDSIGTFLDGVYLTENHPILSEDSALVSYELTFLIVGIIALIYLTLIKKQSFHLPQEKDKFLAATFETAGQFFYVPAIAAADKQIIVAPMIASYSIVSILLGRIILKEKLTIAQYAVIAIIMCAIAILGFYDI